MTLGHEIKASIIVPTYNRSEQLNRTLACILNQSLSPQLFEVIVVDDGSSDDSFLVAQKYARKINLKYIYQDDRGFRVASARNLGIKIASADICIIIDSGILMESNCIEEHIKFHERHPRPIALIGYVFGFDNNESEDEELTSLLLSHANVDETIQYLELEQRFLDIREEEYRQNNYQIELLPAPWAYFWTCQVSINKNSALFGEEFFDVLFEPHYGYEDVDLGYRLHCAGVRIFLNVNAKAVHFPHKKRHNFEEDLSVNAQLFLRKHNTEMVKLFCANNGTFGFNALVNKLYPDGFVSTPVKMI